MHHLTSGFHGALQTLTKDRFQLFEKGQGGQEGCEAVLNACMVHVSKKRIYDPYKGDWGCTGHRRDRLDYTGLVLGHRSRILLTTAIVLIGHGSVTGNRDS